MCTIVFSQTNFLQCSSIRFLSVGSIFMCSSIWPTIHVVINLSCSLLESNSLLPVNWSRTLSWQSCAARSSRFYKISKESLRNELLSEFTSRIIKFARNKHIKVSMKVFNTVFGPRSRKDPLLSILLESTPLDLPYTEYN